MCVCVCVCVCVCTCMMASLTSLLGEGFWSSPITNGVIAGAIVVVAVLSAVMMCLGAVLYTHR